MFYILCIALCLAVLFIVLASMSMLCMWGPRLLRFFARSSAPAANLLFAINILPLLLACLVTFGFALPAFVKFEPRSTSEMMGLRLLGLAVLGAFALMTMGIRCVRIVRATMLVQDEWRGRSKKLHIHGVDVPVYCVDGPRSVLAVLGILQPEIFVAREVARVLSPAELSAALAHERAHVSSFDNLKQLLLKVMRLPRWMDAFAMAEASWINVSEVAADEAALATGASALDLSGALIKVARLSSSTVVGEAVAASHLVPVSGSSVEVRMNHLHELLEGKVRSGRPGTTNGRYGMLLSFVLLAIAYGTFVNGLLPWVHEALESLVR